MGNEPGAWKRTAVISGAIAGVVTLAGTLVGLTPEDVAEVTRASERHAQTEDNAESIRGIQDALEQLDAHLRIYACGDPNLDRTARISLRCHELP